MPMATTHFLRAIFSCVLLLPATMAHSQRVPLYVAYSPSLIDYFYTVAESQRNVAVGFYGYLDYGIAFYVEGSASTLTLPLKRFWKGAPQYDHFYTTSAQDESGAMSFGWVYEGVEGYLPQSQVPDSLPVYRLSRFDGGNGDVAHFYTINAAQVSALQSAGWTSERVEGFAYGSAVSSHPPTPPRLVHATQLTANCFDQFCVKLYGFNFAQNAVVWIRFGGVDGPMIASTSNYVRGTSGDATTLEIQITDPNLTWRLAPPDGLYFEVVNPGNPNAASGALHVLRDSAIRIVGNIDVIDARGMSGWVCGSEQLRGRSLMAEIHVGSDSNKQLQVRANGPRGDLVNVCGGSTAHGFTILWPAQWKDNSTREIHALTNFHEYFFARYARSMIPGGSRFLTLPNVTHDALYARHQAPAVAAPGSVIAASVTMKNLGTNTWFANGAVVLGSANPEGNTQWGLSAVAVNQNVAADREHEFSFNVSAPAREGMYNFQWRMRNGSTYFGDASLNSQIRVLSPPQFYPGPSFPPTYPY